MPGSKRFLNAAEQRGVIRDTGQLREKPRGAASLELGLQATFLWRAAATLDNRRELLIQ